MATETYETKVRRAISLASARLGSSVICGRCGATLEDMADKCSAALDDACPGFVAYDRARTQALREVGAL